MATDSIPQKQCNKCGVWYPATPEYFYTIKSRNNAIRNPCKNCGKASWREYNKSEQGKTAKEKWEKSHPEKRKGYKQDYRNNHPDAASLSNEKYSESHRKEQSERSQQYAKENPHKRAAHMAVKSAVRRKDLPPIKTVQCVICGKPAQDYHHWSYEPEHWLDVIPVCKSCHRKVQQ